MYIETELTLQGNQKAIATPPPRKRHKFEAKVLGRSSFPDTSFAQLTPAQLFEIDCEEDEHEPQTSTPKSRAPAFAKQIDVSNIEQPAARGQQLIDCTTLQQKIDSAVRAALEPVQAQLAEQSKQLGVNELTFTQLRQELTLTQQELSRTQDELARAQQSILHNKFKIQSVEGKQIDQAQKAATPRHQTQVLTSLDVEKMHEFDSSEPSYQLEHSFLSHVKKHAKSRRIFIANVARKMFSTEERARDCNVAGVKNRALLSPTKTRFQKICTYTATHYATEYDSSLATEVRQIIDETNRKFRDDLKKKKSQKLVDDSIIVPQINND